MSIVISISHDSGSFCFVFTRAQMIAGMTTTVDLITPGQTKEWNWGQISGVSLLLTLENIMLIYIVGLLMFWVKSVAPIDYDDKTWTYIHPSFFLASNTHPNFSCKEGWTFFSDHCVRKRIWCTKAI